MTTHISQKGERIILNDDGTLTVPVNPQLILIEGDGIGPELSEATMEILEPSISL